MAAYKKGMSGSGIKDLQTQLNKLGAGLTADGKYGPATERAVVKFQRENGLDDDGIAGPATLAMVERRIHEKIGADMTAALSAIAKVPEVKELEKWLS